jgi:hypothetical protein
MSPAQKSDPDHYEIGQIIQVNDHVKGFALGEQMEVIGVRDDVVRVRSHANTFHPRIKALPLSQPETFEVYERKTIELCEGDKLLITGNGYTTDNHRLNNKTQHQVDHISRDGNLVLENGWEIGKDFQHLSHGWVLTSYAAQGKTVDWVLACQTQELSSMATNRDQYHVATTRGREGMISYTDNFEWLKDAVVKRPERLMATELMNAPVQEPALTARDKRLAELEKVEASREVNEYNQAITQTDEHLCVLEEAEASREVSEYNAGIEPDDATETITPQKTRLAASLGTKDVTMDKTTAQAIEQAIENAPVPERVQGREPEQLEPEIEEIEMGMGM